MSTDPSENEPSATASANVAEPLAASARTSYYCHICQGYVWITRTDPSSEIICPNCSQGFLEEGAEESPDVDEHDEQDTVPLGGLLGQLFGSLQQQQQFASDSRRPDASTPDDFMARRPDTPTPNDFRAPNDFMGMFLQQLMNNLGAGQVQFEVRQGGGGGNNQGFNMFGGGSLHGNPGDYAWGPDGLDEIVTQLLNQFDGGARPLTDQQIARIPTVPFKNLDANVQCTTCFDDFKADEMVRELPCRHLFHTDCIVPWLKQHNTCPICRKALEEEGAAATGNTATSGGASLLQSLQPFLLPSQTSAQRQSTTGQQQRAQPRNAPADDSGTIMDQIDELD